MSFSWQASLWQQLIRSQQERKLPHALLFTGPKGVGKREFAQELAKFVLCEAQEKDAACGLCHACCLVQAQSHPDFHVIEPEEEGRAIKIDQIRDLSEFIQQTSHQGGYRVVIVQPATAMNINAANALLKTLEEPTLHSLLILIHDQLTSLPITLSSRCQKIRFLMPPQEQALDWLNSQDPQMDWAPILSAAQGAPLLARAWHLQGIWPLYQNFTRDLMALTQQQADPLQLAMQWKETNMLWLFDLFFQWLLKILRAQYVSEANDEFSNTPLVNCVSVARLFEFADYLQRLRLDVLGPYNLNQQLLLESIFIRWSLHVSR